MAGWIGPVPCSIPIDDLPPKPLPIAANLLLCEAKDGLILNRNKIRPNQLDTF
jgi:hypothetical protein